VWPDLLPADLDEEGIAKAIDLMNEDSVDLTLVGDPGDAASAEGAVKNEAGSDVTQPTADAL
jgi:hypothetical protein